MKPLNSATMLAAVAATAMLNTTASATPAFDRVPGAGLGLIEKARIICEPFGRCFRIDAYGRRIFVPRPFGFGRPEFDGPEVGRPGFGRPGFDGPVFGRPGPDRGPGFGERDGDRGPMGRPGDGRRPRADQDGMQRDPRNQGAGQTPRQGDGLQQRQGEGQQQRPGAGHQQRQGDGQNGNQQQRRQRPPQQDNGQ